MYVKGVRIEPLIIVLLSLVSEKETCITVNANKNLIPLGMQSPCSFKRLPSGGTLNLKKEDCERKRQSWGFKKCACNTPSSTNTPTPGESIQTVTCLYLSPLSYRCAAELTVNQNRYEKLSLVCCKLTSTGIRRNIYRKPNPLRETRLVYSCRYPGKHSGIFFPQEGSIT